MLGAKNVNWGQDRKTGRGYLQFRIGRNDKGVNNIKITLTPLDLYDVEFHAIRTPNVKLKSEAKGIYADMLHQSIESNTGMRTSMGF